MSSQVGTLPQVGTLTKSCSNAGKHDGLSLRHGLRLMLRK